MFRTTIKNLAARKLRLLLTAISIVLGVGFIAGTFVLTDTMNQTFDELFNDATAGVDIYVRAADANVAASAAETATIPQRYVNDIAAVEGVRSATGSVSGYAQFIGKNGQAVIPSGAPTLGASWNDGSSAVTIREGRAPTTSKDVVIDARTAEAEGFAVGDTVEIVLDGAIQSFDVTGIIGFGEADNLGGATMAGFELGTAQRLFNKVGELDSIEVLAEEGVEASELVERIGALLPDEYRATSAADVAAEQSAAIKDQLSFFTTSLLVFAAVAVLVGAFIIFNTFSIVVAQRTREFALLKSLGASGGQIMRSVLLEAIIIGLVASVAGLAAGVGIAVGLKALLAAFGLDLPSTDLQLLPRTILVSLGIGLLVTLVASMLPARKAARVSPMAALRSASPGVARWSKRRTTIGVGLVSVGGLLLATGTMASGGGPSVAGVGALAVFFGVAVLTPLFAGPLAKLLGAPFERAFGISAKLARENAARNPKRTAATASALMIGLALASLVAIMATSIKVSSAQVLDESIQADLVVMSGGMMMQGPGFSHMLAEDVAKLDEVGDAATLTYADLEINGKTTQAAAFDPESFRRVTNFSLTAGDISDFGKDDILVNEETSEEMSLTVGDRLKVKFARTGDNSLTVAGTFASSGVFSSDYVMSNETYMQHYRSHTVDVMLLTAAEGTPVAETQRAVEEATAQLPTVEVKDQAAFKKEQAGHIDQLLALVTALLGLALLIALFGITNTLALSVFERIREIGLLRAVGMLRSQMRASIRWEALIVSSIGALLGIGVGVFFGWSVVKTLESDGISHFAVPVPSLAAYLVAAGIAGVLAALPPARRAGKLNVLEAIATE